MGMFDSGKTAARVTSYLYHAAGGGAGVVNPSGAPTLNNTTPSNWQMRTTNTRNFFLGMASDGVIDLGFCVHHTLKAASVGVQMAAVLYALVDLDPVLPGTVKNSQTLWSDTLPADPRFWFLPERGTSQPGTTTQKIIEVPELRQPIHKFLLTLTPVTAPDEGDLYIRVVRRY